MINNFLLVLLENRDSLSPFVICNCWLTDLQPEMVECKQLIEHRISLHQNVRKK